MAILTKEQKREILDRNRKDWHSDEIYAHDVILNYIDKYKMPNHVLGKILAEEGLETRTYIVKGKRFRYGENKIFFKEIVMICNFFNIPKTKLFKK